MRDFTVPPQVQTSFGSYLPSILGAIAILVGGIIVALLVRAGIRKAMIALRVDERVNQETHTKIELTRLVASMGFWFVMILALLGMFSILRIEGLSGPFEALVSSIMLYLPRILLAAILVLVAWLLATLLRAGLNRLMAMTGWDEKLSASAGVKPLSSVLGQLYADASSRAMVAGYYDGGGDQATNASLSRERSESVQQWLIANGVASDRIELLLPEATDAAAADGGRMVAVMVQ